MLLDCREVRLWCYEELDRAAITIAVVGFVHGSEGTQEVRVFATPRKQSLAAMDETKPVSYFPIDPSSYFFAAGYCLHYVVRYDRMEAL